MDQEEYARELRARVDRVVPRIAVEAAAVIRSGRRRRAARTGLAGLTAVVLVGTVGGAVTLRPWAVGTTPAGSGVSLSSGGTASPTPSGRPIGWPDAKYWHVTALYSASGAPALTRDDWYGHWDPSEFIENGDLAHPSFAGPWAWPPDDWDPATQNGWDVLDALPTDPTSLNTRLHDAVANREAALAKENGDYGVGTADDKVWAQIVTMLPGSPASKALREALVAVAKALPGTQVTPGTVDASGRTGVGITRADGGGGRRTLVVAAADATVLAMVLTGPDGKTTTTTYLSAGPADAPPVVPDLAASGCAQWSTC